MSSVESKVCMLLELYSVEEALEVLDITAEECIEILVRGGHCALPDFLDIEDGRTSQES